MVGAFPFDVSVSWVGSPGGVLGGHVVEYIVGDVGECVGSVSICLAEVYRVDVVLEVDM